MRTQLTIFAAALVLSVGCTQTTQPARISPAAPSPSSSVSSPPTAAAAIAPTAGASMSDIIGWVAAGEPADTTGYHTATRDDGAGAPAADLGEDVAFTTPAGMSCMTDSTRGDGALACLVNLETPPPPPAELYGQWIAGWVDFDGEHLTIGSVRGDPGRFLAGDGAALDDGASLRFADYQCRTTAEALYCVHYARQSAVKISPAGVEPFGCLAPVTPAPPDVGRQFSC